MLDSLTEPLYQQGFFLASTLGTAGVTASAFVSNYQIPLRLLSIVLLIWAYYSTSKKLTKSCMKSYLLLLFTANQHQVLQINPYPPFGLPTICYVGLASYLILIGVYSSALSVAEDKKLRQLIRTSVVKEANLLDSMGTAIMEDRIRQKVAKITREQKMVLIQQTGIESSLDDTEISQLVDTVILEVKRSRRPK